MKDKNFKIRSATALEPFRVAVEFDSLGVVEIDLEEHMLGLKAFDAIRHDAELFAKVVVDEWGWYIAWSEDGGDAEISSLTLHRLHLYQTRQAMRPADFNAWMERHGFSLSQAASELGISRRTVAYYKSGEQIIPRTVLLAAIGWEDWQADRELRERKAKFLLEVRAAEEAGDEKRVKQLTEAFLCKPPELLSKGHAIRFRTRPGIGVTVVPKQNGEWELRAGE